MSRIREIRDKLKHNKNLTTYDDEEIEFVQTTVGRALYQDGNPKVEFSDSDEDDQPKPKPKAHWSDRIACEICGKVFTRSSRSAHKASLYHRMKEKEHEKLKRILID